MATLRTFAQLQSALGVALLLPEPTGPATAVAESLLLDTFVFQYFPETLQDNQTANYEQTQIPGGSHPLYQWVSGGPRVISFTAQFTSERLIPPGIIDVRNRYNVDINGAIAALRYFLYPKYDPTAALRASPPPRLFLVIPGTLLGGFVPPVRVVMTDMQVEINQWHAAGIPKLAKVALTFNEVVQSATGGVRFVGRDTFEVPKVAYNPIAVAARRASF